MNQNGMRNYRRWCHPIVGLDNHFDSLGREDFQRSALGRGRERMSIFSHVQRTIDILGSSVIANRLGDRQDMCLGEGAVQAAAAMTSAATLHCPASGRWDR